jgi:NAD(P)-dependent dehydrogenase (short-subunit alcohol dehydrogenase family)
MNFKDKVVIITGGGAGIGRAAAVAFSERNAHVVVADIDSLRGEETVSIIKEIEKNLILLS